MPAKIYTDLDIDLSVIADRRVAMVGYGSQGRAHALNLRDSGIDVTVGLRHGSPTIERVRSEGLRAASIAEACGDAQVIALMLPDQVQPQVYRTEVEPHLRVGNALLFAHGFNIHYRQIEPPEGTDVVMVGPKAPGPALRELYEQGRGAPAVIAVHVDASGKASEIALAYAKAIGCARAGILRTTFEEETESDLFGEQAVLAGGVAHLIELGFETLVDAGFQPEIAYFECLHEMKLVVDIIQRRGISGLGHAISDTAEYGSRTRGPRVLDDHVRATMAAILSEIRSGAFAEEWTRQVEEGSPDLTRLRREVAEHPIEKVGAPLRRLMWGDER